MNSPFLTSWLTILICSVFFGCSFIEDDSQKQKSVARDASAEQQQGSSETNADQDLDQSAKPTPPATSETQTKNDTCDESKKGTADPKTIEEFVGLVNSLEKPLSIPCLVHSLKRPLQVNATSSQLSVQPAVSKSTPRIFILRGNLVMTFVPSGEGSKDIELSYITGGSESIKGEIPFPVTESIATSLPYTQILRNDATGTTCAGCHAGETSTSDSFPADTFVSTALRPRAFGDVPVEYLESQQKSCGSKLDLRCRILNALFDGEVQQTEFPSSMPTIF